MILFWGGHALVSFIINPPIDKTRVMPRRFAGAVHNVSTYTRLSIPYITSLDPWRGSSDLIAVTGPVPWPHSDGGAGALPADRLSVHPSISVVTK